MPLSLHVTGERYCHTHIPREAKRIHGDIDRIINDKKHIVPKLVEGIFNYNRWRITHRWPITYRWSQMTIQSQMVDQVICRSRWPLLPVFVHNVCGGAHIWTCVCMNVWFIPVDMPFGTSLSTVEQWLKFSNNTSCFLHMFYEFLISSTTGEHLCINIISACKGRKCVQQ